VVVLTEMHNFATNAIRTNGDAAIAVFAVYSDTHTHTHTEK